MRIGILGGTFNPIHYGHLHLAEEALRQLRLDRLIFVPTYIPPHKKISGRIPSHHRLAMLRRAIAGRSNYRISRFEIDKKGISYTIDTVRALAKAHKKDKLFFIAGADTSGQIARWKDSRALFELVSFYIADRPGFSFRGMPKRARHLPIEDMDISSRAIRRKTKRGESLEGFVPPAVEEYIKKYRIYQNR